MNDLAIIVQTCDKYADLWPHFYKLFKKYWPDCPFNIYHVTETKTCDVDGAFTINTGQGKEWSDRLKFALERINQKYVLLLLDDYFLIKQVKNQAFYRCIEIMKTENPACLRIFPVPGPDKLLEKYNDIGIINFDSPYSISTQAAIWNSDSLINFLQPHESVWDLELRGSKRANELKRPILSLVKSYQSVAENGNYPYTYLCTAVYKGKWMREVLSLMKEENIEIDFNIRALESKFEQFYRKNYTKSPLLLKHLLDSIKKRIL